MYALPGSGLPESGEVCVVDHANGDISDCSDVTINDSAGGECSVMIYEGNEPGRRDIPINCYQTIELNACTEDCGTPSCYEWKIDPPSAIGSAIITNPDGSALYTSGCDCYNLTQETIVVVDNCNGFVSDSINISVGSVLVNVYDGYGFPGNNGVPIKVGITNNDQKIKGLQLELKDDCDYLTCTGCQADPDRAPQFMCAAMEQASGACRVVFVSTNPTAFIQEGDGPAFSVSYDIKENLPQTACCEINPENIMVADTFGDPLSVCSEPGQICPVLCGDLYPRDCLPEQPNCGDGKINIFDILEEVDIVLGVVQPSDCQRAMADVPTGTPPYCSDPDNEIDIFDVLVIIDKALGKANCCDYYYLGIIY
jgi:hypothetical protein